LSLTFFNQFNPNQALFPQATFSIFFSTTHAVVNGLSDDLPSNVGTPEALFATVATTGGVSGPQFTINGSGYVYDPTLGNLLMDIFFTLEDQTPIPMALESADNSGTVTSLALRNKFTSMASVGGLVTEFNATPEPTTLVLMATGLIGIGVW